MHTQLQTAHATPQTRHTAQTSEERGTHRCGPGPHAPWRRHARPALCGRLREGATLARNVYLLIYINERLYQPAPRLGARTAAFVLGTGRSSSRGPAWGSSSHVAGDDCEHLSKARGSRPVRGKGLAQPAARKGGLGQRERGDPAGSCGVRDPWRRAETLAFEVWRGGGGRFGEVGWRGWGWQKGESWGVSGGRRRRGSVE